MDNLLERRGRSLGSAYRLFYDEPLEVVRGDGVHLWDAAGRRYLDAYNNVASVGHCHPRVVAALTKQASALNTHTRYLGAPVVDYAEALLEMFPPSLDRLVFTCTGSESNDLAYRIARVTTGGTGMIVTDNAYHGVTAAVSALSPSLGRAVAPGPNVWTVRAPDTFQESAESVASRLASDVRDVLTSMDRAGVKPAAMFIDTVLASDGIQPGVAGMLASAAEVVQQAGALLVADEVQAGLGRVGQKLWGFARHGLTPDIVTLGKPMGNGHPIGAVVSRAELMDEFGSAARYFNTFGGNTVSAAVGLEVLNVLRDEDLPLSADAVGAHLRSGLEAVQAAHDFVVDIRQAGLYIGVEIASADGLDADGQLTRRLVNMVREQGVLINTAGPAGNVLKIRPPLPFTSENADEVVETIDRCLARLEREG